MKKLRGGWSYLLVLFVFEGNTAELDLEGVVRSWMMKLFGLLSLAELRLKVIRDHTNERKFIIRFEKKWEERVRMAFSLLKEIDGIKFNAVVVGASGTLKGCKKMEQRLEGYQFVSRTP